MSRSPRFGVDALGRPIVRVPLNLPAGLWATLDAADYDAWIASGRSLGWSLDGNGLGTFTRLRCSVKRRRFSVARLLTGARPGQHVGPIDLDPLNLRRSNLRVSDGPFKARKEPLACP